MQNAKLDWKRGGCVVAAAPFVAFPCATLWLVWDRGLAVKALGFVLSLILAGVTAASIINGLGKIRKTTRTADEDWAWALFAMDQDLLEEAVDSFADAVRKDPWKYCGVGRGSIVPPDHPKSVNAWLDGMRRAGFGELASYLNAEPWRGDSLDALTEREAERRAILHKICGDREHSDSGD